MPHLPSERTVAKLLRWFHLAAIFVWLALIPPTVIWWKNSIRWIGFMSIYAIVIAHFTAYMASRTEKREMERDQGQARSTGRTRPEAEGKPMTLIGAAVTPTSGQSWAQAITAFETATSRPMPVRRCYDGAPPTSVAGGQLSKDAGLRASVYSIKPTMSTPIATLDSLATDIAASVAATGFPCDVIIYHEPVDNMSGADFIALYQRSAPSFRAAGVPVGVCFTNWSCNLAYSDTQSALAHYWPGDGLVDFIAIDEYPIGEITSTKDATPMEQRARRVAQFADARGIPLGLAEYGVDVTWDVKKSDNWLRSVTTWAQMREAAGTPLRFMTYFSCISSPYNWTISNKQEYVDSYVDSYRILAS